MEYFVKMKDSRETEELIGYPDGFALAALIAKRATGRPEFSAKGLAQGEALLGDYEAIGLTERRYRTAKEKLEAWGVATFKATNKGTVGRLLHTRIFEPWTPKSDEQSDEQEKGGTGNETGGFESSEGEERRAKRRASDEPATSQRRASDEPGDEPATTNLDIRGRKKIEESPCSPPTGDGSGGDEAHVILGGCVNLRGLTWELDLRARQEFGGLERTPDYARVAERAVRDAVLWAEEIRQPGLWWRKQIRKFCEAEGLILGKNARAGRGWEDDPVAERTARLLAPVG